jgi:hypothetical protein
MNGWIGVVGPGITDVTCTSVHQFQLPSPRRSLTTAISVENRRRDRVVVPAAALAFGIFIQPDARVSRETVIDDIRPAVGP